MDKRKLCKIHYKDQTNILEIGCSTGNIAQAFVKNNNIRYTGIDLDSATIQSAQHSFRKRNNFRFLNTDLRDFCRGTTEKYDYILFAGIVHHIDDSMVIELLNTAIGLLSSDGILVVVDPLLPDKNDPMFTHYFIKLEQGSFVRTEKEMLDLLKKISGISLGNTATHYVNATPFKFPVCAKFGVYRYENKH